MKGILLLSIFFCQLCHAQFTGNYAPGKFTYTKTNSNGTATFNGSSSLTINGTDNENEDFTGGIDIESVNVVSSGLIHFTYTVTSVDTYLPAGDYDDFGYSINGVMTNVTYQLGSNSIDVPVTAGQVFAFFVSSADNNYGGLNVTVSNFTFSSPLPLTLINFNAISTSTNTNMLNWTTSNETNTHAFEIQRSTDGVSFEKVGLIPAAINSFGTKKYSYYDNYNFLQGSAYYYRLKMIDIDMRYTYSSIISIKSKGQPEIKVSPNPFLNKLQINYPSTEAGTATMELIDMAGRKVLTEKRSIQIGGNLIEINPPVNLVKGVYLLHISTLIKETFVKVIKE